MNPSEESTWNDLIGIPADPPVRRDICDHCKYGVSSVLRK